MPKKLAKTIINIYGIAFIAAGLIAIFLYFRIVAGAFIFIIVGVALWRRKAFGIYSVFFLAFVLAGIGLIIAGLAARDILHRLYKFDMLGIGFAPILFSFLTFYFFTRREVAEEFGLSKITILEKIDKQELIVAGKVLFWIAVIVGAVLLLCYLAAMLMTHSGFKP